MINRQFLGRSRFSDKPIYSVEGSFISIPGLRAAWSRTGDTKSAFCMHRVNAPARMQYLGHRRKIKKKRSHEITQGKYLQLQSEGAFQAPKPHQLPHLLSALKPFHPSLSILSILSRPGGRSGRRAQFWSAQRLCLCASSTAPWPHRYWWPPAVARPQCFHAPSRTIRNLGTKKASWGPIHWFSLLKLAWYVRWFRAVQFLSFSNSKQSRGPEKTWENHKQATIGLNFCQFQWQLVHDLSRALYGPIHNISK